MDEYENRLFFTHNDDYMNPLSFWLVDDSNLSSGNVTVVVVVFIVVVLLVSAIDEVVIIYRVQQCPYGKTDGSGGGTGRGGGGIGAGGATLLIISSITM